MRNKPLNKENKKPTCHPEREYFHCGLCPKCYYKKKWAKIKEDPIKLEKALAYMKETNKRLSLDPEFMAKKRLHSREAKRKLHKENPTLRKYEHLYKRHGLTKEAHDKMFVYQDYKCKICSKRHSEQDKLNVDHNHATGKIRGLLCRKCNLTLGTANDDIQILENAISYLKEYDALLPCDWDSFSASTG